MLNRITLALIAAIITIQSNAEYTMKYNIETSPNSIKIIGWSDTLPNVIDWTVVGNSFDCSVFTPSANTITIGQTFEQTRNCSVNEEKITQNRKISDKGIYKNEGSPIIESRVSEIIESNTSIGLKDCRYDLNNYNWIYDTSLQTAIYWNGVLIYYSAYDHPSNYYPSVDVNGFNYERNYIPTEITGVYHGICRTPL